MRFLWVGLAGALGAMSRYAISRAVGVTRFPWATFAINVSGAFALALLLTVVTHRRVSADVATALSVGFLGAYTTFSTMAWETFDLGRDGREVTAALYISASVVAGVVAAVCGHALGRALR